MAEHRIPPQSLESERALLGALLLKPEAIHDISDTVRPDSFYAEKHRTIFETMRELSDRGEPIDLLSLSERLQSKSLLERCGGRSYIAELTNSAPAAGNFSHYAELVIRKHLMRSLIEASGEIAEAAYDEARDTAEVLDQAEKSIYAIGNASASHKFIAIGEKIDDAWERIDALSKNDGAIRGVPTGYPDLDNLLSGLHKSDLVILAARPSVGKTSLALDIARNAAIRHDVPVGIFSLEMSSEQIIDRLLSAESYVNSWKIRTGAVREEADFERIRDAMEVLSKAPIYIDDKPGNNILSMRAVARRLKRERGIGLIIVDYLQLMAPTNTKASDSMVQQVTEISRSLKSLARELEVPVLALSQLSEPWSSAAASPASPTSAIPAPSSRTPTSSCSSIGRTARTMRATGRTSPRSSSRSTATARPAASSSISTRSAPATCRSTSPGTAIFQASSNIENEKGRIFDAALSLQAPSSCYLHPFPHFACAEDSRQADRNQGEQARHPVLGIVSEE